MSKKAIYIAGPITGVNKYYEPFETAAEAVQAAGLIPLNPCWQPQGLPRETYMKLGLTMLSCADGVLFLPGWSRSAGCQLEMSYCENTGKPLALFFSMDRLPDAVQFLKDKLEEGET